MTEDYKEDFESEHSIKEAPQQTSIEPAPTTAPVIQNKAQPTTTEKPHYLRFSIDTKAIKDLKFDANVIVEYAFSLSITTFRSFPPSTVTKGKMCELQNTFSSFDFNSTQSELGNILNSSSLVITFYHCERADSTTFIGKTSMQISNVLNGTNTKTPQSIALALDGYYPIDAEGKIGEARVIIYLEDMGISLQKQQTAEKDVNKSMMASDNDSKVVWELENWKHTEEIKFKSNLKILETQTLNKIAEDYGAKETERQKEFLEAMQKINTIELKIKKSANELQMREQKIIRSEEELKAKINEVGKQLVEKEEEIVKIRASQKDEKLKMDKEKKELLIQLEKAKNQTNELKNTLEEQQKEYQGSPINLLRQEITSKGVEIMELQRQLDKSAQVKEQYKVQYDKMKLELIKMKKAFDEEKENAMKRKIEEYERITLQFNTQKIANEEQNEIAQLKEQIATLQTKLTHVSTERQMVSSLDTNKMPILEIKPQTVVASSIPSPHKDQPKGTDLETLLKERDELLGTGLYNEYDGIIIEYNKLIEGMKK